MGFSKPNIKKMEAKRDVEGLTKALKNKNQDVREEALRRNAKAGYCNSEGGPASSGRIVSKPANDRYRKNYDKIDWSKK